MRQFREFVKAELEELNSRDADQLFDCIKDNLEEIGLKLNESMQNDLYKEIEFQLKILEKTLKVFRN